VNQLRTAGGLLMEDTQLSVIVSPALALRCPLIVTLSGATVAAAATCQFNIYTLNINTRVLHGGLALGRWTCDLQVAGSISGRSAFT